MAHVLCCRTKATHTKHTRYMQILLPFHGNNDFANAPRCYVYTYSDCLVYATQMLALVDPPSSRNNIFRLSANANVIYLHLPFRIWGPQPPFATSKWAITLWMRPTYGRECWIKGWWGYLGLWRWWCEQSGGNCVKTSFTIGTTHKTLLGWRNKKGDMSEEHGIYVGEENCIQYSDGKDGRKDTTWKD